MIVFSLSKDWYCGIDSQHCKYWNIYWVLIVLRFTKSGIEYVILAGSSLFQLSRAESRFLTVKMADLARAAAIFSRIWGFWAPETQNFRWPAGACAQSGVPALQVLEYLLGLIGYCKYWKNLWHTFGLPYHPSPARSKWRKLLGVSHLTAAALMLNVTHYSFFSDQSNYFGK